MLIKRLRVGLQLARRLIDYGSPFLTCRKLITILRSEGWGGIRHRIQFAAGLAQVTYDPHKGEIFNGMLYGRASRFEPNFMPRVSIIVPNYNHAAYLRQRLDSIYAQDYKNVEVILLDDCSTDGSREILTEYLHKHSDCTVAHFNEVNSGGVFKQWRKAIDSACGDLIWIAESDDYCDSNYLSELVGCFRDPAVMLAFARTDFVDDKGQPILSTEQYLRDCLGGLSKQSFVRSAHWLVNHAWGVKNILPNVSGAVFRRPRNMQLLQREAWLCMRLCGDWMFYLYLVRGGLVAYCSAVKNYYRQHEGGTSLKVRRGDDYYREVQEVSACLLELYRIPDRLLLAQHQRLYGEWRHAKGSDRRHEFDQLVSVSKSHAMAGHRSPNILMVSYALASGGGETFPILLANALKRRGHSISFLNMHEQATEIGILHMLDPGVPLFELNSTAEVSALCEDLGIELVHSHHAWCDVVLARCLRGLPRVRHLVTMHGMYELMPDDAFARVLPLIEKEIDAIVYTADKNLEPFGDGALKGKRLARIDNALERTRIQPVDRREFGFGTDDFVLCLVSRAIPEKGWEEGIKAVLTAQKSCARPIRLILIGDGPECERLKPLYASQSVVFLGFQSDIRGYFAMADMGFLPSRFGGESAPLVLIDCLYAGRPMLASRMGEIPHMLSGDMGMAGVVFPLHQFSIDVAALATLISMCVTDRLAYARMCDCVVSASRKFDMDIMVEKYEQIYDVTAFGDDGGN